MTGPEGLPGRAPLIVRQAGRFSLVGALGFVIDAGLLGIFTQILELDPFFWRLVSFLAAASTTWILHRKYTFRAGGPWTSQWFRFVLFNGLGALLNFGVYAALLLYAPAPVSHPLAAVTVSSALAWGFNFAVCKWVVFGGRG